MFRGDQISGYYEDMTSRNNPARLASSNNNADHEVSTTKLNKDKSSLQRSSFATDNRKYIPGVNYKEQKGMLLIQTLFDRLTYQANR
jgi:hypothetical protein